MVAKSLLPRCTAFFNRISIESLEICNSSAMHLGKKFVATILSAILYSNCSLQFNLDMLHMQVASSTPGGGIHNMSRVRVYAAHIGGFLGPKFFQGSFLGRFPLKNG